MQHANTLALTHDEKTKVGATFIKTLGLPQFTSWYCALSKALGFTLFITFNLCLGHHIKDFYFEERGYHPIIYLLERVGWHIKEWEKDLHTFTCTFNRSPISRVLYFFYF